MRNRDKRVFFCIYFWKPFYKDSFIYNLLVLQVRGEISVFFKMLKVSLLLGIKVKWTEQTNLIILWLSSCLLLSITSTLCFIFCHLHSCNAHSLWLQGTETSLEDYQTWNVSHTLSQCLFTGIKHSSKLEHSTCTHFNNRVLKRLKKGKG